MANQDDWASDDKAEDLLSGVLHETEDEAKEEIEQVEKELQQRREEEERRRREEEERRRAEAEARITAEEERLDELEQRRTERLQAIEREKMREQGIVPESERPDEDEESDEAQTSESAVDQPESEADGQPDEQQLGAEVDTDRQPDHLDQAGSSTGPWIAAAVVVLAVGAGVGGYFYMNRAYEPDDTPYSKAVYEPTEPKIHLVEASATMLADEPTESEETSSAPPPRDPAPAPSRPSGGGDSGESEEDDDLDINLEGADPFGGDDL